MTGVAEIIVTANAGTVSDVGDPPSVGNVPAQMLLQSFVAHFDHVEHFEKEEEVDDSIVVIGQRLKDEMRSQFVHSMMTNAGSPGIRINLPCIGSVAVGELAAALHNMKFTASDRDFGPGRAGENAVGGAGAAVPVVINADALKGYDARQNGLPFLVAHETAHSLKAMQEYNKQQWNAYINGPGKGLPLEQQRAQYPNSDQFKANEARANTVAKAILDQWDKDSIVPDPENGYQVC